MPRNLWGPPEWHWRHMPAATLGAGAGITPVTNTWYTVLDAVNVRLKSLVVWHTNDEAAAKEVESRLMIDGVSCGLITSSLNASSVRYNRISNAADLLIAGALFRNATWYGFLEAKTAKYEVRTTSAVGTNPLLFASAQYEQLERRKIT